MTDTDRDTLADDLRDWRLAECPHTLDIDREPCCAPCLRDRILASDWLAAREREAAAKAWDEGERAGWDAHWRSVNPDRSDGPTRPANPYRADTYEGEA